METWIIAIGAILICGCMLATSVIMMKQQQDELEKARRDSEALTRLPEENHRLYQDNVQLVRRNRSLERRLNEEMDRAEALEEELEHVGDVLAESEQRAAEALREITTARVRGDRAEAENVKLQREMKAQEELYQALINDQEGMIRRLQQKPARRKNAILENQITLDELMEE